MTIKTIYTRNHTQFSERIAEWCANKNVECLRIDKEDKPGDDIEGLVIFHEDHNYDNHAAELREVFEKRLKPIHKIDVNGTKQVSISHFELWLERNQCKEILILGTDSLLTNPNFELLLNKM